MTARKKPRQPVEKVPQPVERYVYIADDTPDAILFPSQEELLSDVEVYFEGCDRGAEDRYFVYRLQPIGRIRLGGATVEPYDEQEDDDL